MPRKMAEQKGIRFRSALRCKPFVNRTRCERIGCYPSTGAMAVALAMERCVSVRLYGFGGPAPSASGECAAGDSKCLIGRHCARYYQPELSADLVSVREARNAHPSQALLEHQDH